jgi:hypothetical protein
MQQIILVAAAFAVTACASVDYTSQRFQEESRNHRTVAVLPFEMVLDGRLPSELTDQRVAEIEEAESLVFQTALYHSMLDRSGSRRKRPISILIQSPDTTNRILRGAGIDARRSWTIPAEELATILGVDAVVRTTVQKTRLLSDGASFGIEAGTAVFNEATGWQFPWLVPHGLSATSTVWTDATLVDADGGDVLWKVVIERSADWSRPADAVVVDITRALAKRFPYRA